MSRRHDRRSMRAPVAGLLLATLCITAVRADDSELFLSDPEANTARANVLFLIDTSSSMETLVATQAPFDTAQTFSGCYDSNALYYSANGATPACDSPDLLPKGLNRCAASALPLTTVGYYSDFLLAWDASRDRWDALTPDRMGPVECKGDRGVDGDGSANKSFAANGPDGPWSGTDENEPAWTTEYTVYDGNWLNWRSNPPTVERSRIDIVKESVNALIAGLRDVNVGVMRFNGEEGGAVVAALDDIETSRESLTAIVNGLTTTARTPLSEALYEAAQMFRGADVDYGNRGAFRSVAASRVGNTSDSPLYRSPITESCNKNFIILLTDGEPSGDTSANGKITALPGFNTVVGPGCDGSGEGRCLDDLAAYLRNQDLAPSLPGLQNVITHTIGFEVDFPLLVSTAARGGGEYHLADDTASLSTALSGIVLSIFDNTGTFAAPAVPVNAFNRTQNLSDVFISVFHPTETARWLGNLKKYRLEDGVLVGRDGRPVIDPVTGLFSRTAISFWSDKADGDRVSDGGAASRLGTRDEVLTNLADDGDLTPLDPGDEDVLAALSAVPVAEREAVINWALGRDVRDVDLDGDVSEPRLDMGDAFHVQPVTVFYAGTLEAPVATVFLATNDGFLHAFDTETGRERWAFVPKRLLNNLYPLYRNEAASRKTYGLDGDINVVVVNDDGRPGIDAGVEQVILLFGMGRGGDAVFALDVTDRERPRLLWTRSSADEGFEDLGQTWSSPLAARVACTACRSPATGPNVAFFGGGYDPGQDNGRFEQDSIGNAIYMVDLQTGRRLWSAGGEDGAGPHDLRLPAMNYSIPAPVKPLDLDGDGLAERLYVGDMGGQVWRFDIINGEGAGALVQAGVLASLGGAALDDPAPADLRRFYEAPDVVPVILDNRLVITVNLGSGYRGHPLDTSIEEAFFSIRDFDVFGLPDLPTSPVSVGQLVDITGDTEPDLPFATAGWQLRLVQGAGEKVLGESLTIDNTVFFTSFTPGATASECTSGSGTNRLYAISVFDGSARTNFDSPVGEPLTLADRSRTLTTGIPVTDVSLIRDEKGNPTISAGTEYLSPEEVARLEWRREPWWRTYWYQREGQAN